MTAVRVAVASCLRLPEPDPDEPLLLAALERAGVDARVLAWDDAGAPFADQALVVVRSTWNYHDRLDAFLAWTRAVGATTRLANAPGVIAWNATKTYLRDLDARGVAAVPTEFVARGERRDLGAVLDARGWREIVVKPVVSAGSYRTARFGRDRLADAQAFLEDLTRDRGAMIQRWMPDVEAYGERSLVWIDGEVTHAVRKSPRFADGHERVSEEVAFTPEERAFAERALEAAGAPDLLYARVDMVRDPEGALRIMELELIEPSLFLAQAPRAAERLAAAIARRLRA